MMNEQELLNTWKQEESIAHIHGWDFSHIAGRYTEEMDLPWDYQHIILDRLKPEMKLLDVDTGGGEFLLSLHHPSSTTMLALCILPTAMMQLKTRIRGDAVRRAILGILAAFTFFMVVGRLISGVHWLTDIIGGVLLSVGLVMLYAFATKRQGKSRKNSLACV